MWRAAMRAARRRGSSTRMDVPARNGAAASASGTRVVLPAPGGACSTSVPARSSSCRMRGISGSIGRSVTTVLCGGGAHAVNAEKKVGGIYAKMFHVKHRGLGRQSFYAKMFHVKHHSGAPE